MRKAVAFGLLFVVLVMTFALLGVALADRSLSVEHTTSFASVLDADTETDDDRIISGERTDGDVEADRDVIVNADSRIRGDVEAGSDATISDSRVDGDVEADRDVIVKAESRVDGDVEADGDVEIESNSRIRGDLEAGGDVISSKHSQVDGEIDADGDVIDEDGQATPELSDLNIAGQGAEATTTEAEDEDISIVVENVGDADGAFEVTLAIGDTLEVTETTDELATGETVTATFSDVTGGFVADGYTVEVSAANDMVSGTLEILVDEQEDQSEVDEQEDQSENDEQEGDDDDRENEGDEDEREGTFEISTASVSNTVITAGESLQLGLQVENVGDRDGAFDADLFVDGESVDSASVTVEAGGTETMAFSYQFDDPGEYEIAVGNRLMDTVTVTPANKEESGMERSGDDATAIEIVQATVPADWVRQGYETSALVTVENTVNRTANRTLTVTIDDQPVATETVTLQPHERDRVTIKFEPTTGSVVVEDIDAGWIDTSETLAEVDSAEEDDEETTGFGFGGGIAALLAIVGALAGVAVLKTRLIADNT